MLANDVGVPYRFAQFWWAITAYALPASSLLEIESILGTGEWELFQHYSPSDQRHAYQVYLMLQGDGNVPTDLLAAGLLHDIGKARVPLSVWERVLIVIGEALFPTKVSVWGEGKTQGWKRPFVVRTQHPEWGAEMAEAAGSNVRIVNLIRRHQDPLPAELTRDEDDLLCLLQWADNQS